MLNEQKDWTLKLFLHNFLKESNLKNSLQSFENEVLQTPNFNQDLPIKSNKTFLFEWWNIFFYLYSERLIEDFTEKNRGLYTDRILTQLKMSDLFINSNNNLPTFLNSQNSEQNNMKNISNGLGFNSTKDNKNFSKPMNLQYNGNNFNNVSQNDGNYNSSIGFSSQETAKRNYDNNINLKTQENFNKEFKNPQMNKNRPFITNAVNSIANNSNNSNDAKNKEFIAKMRRRSIKNNKIVFVHSANAAARKMASEAKESDDELKGEDLMKLDENFDYSQSEMNYANSNQGNNDNSGGNSNKKPRGSRYRGVSRNGNQWQVLIMVNKKKRYVGSYSNEEEAARAYDKAALQNHGTKAKTNFDYVDEDLKRIMGEPPILKIND